MTEGKWRISSTLSLTWAPSGGGWSTPRPSSFIPGKDSVPFVQEVRWSTEPVWTGAEYLLPTGVQTPHRPGSRKSLYQLCYAGWYTWLHHADTDWGAYPTSYSMIPESPFLGGKSGGTQRLNTVCVTSGFCRDNRRVKNSTKNKSVFAMYSTPNAIRITHVTALHLSNIPQNPLIIWIKDMPQSVAIFHSRCTDWHETNENKKSCLQQKIPGNISLY